MIYAVRKKNESLAQFLLASGADVNAQSQGGYTVLMLAVLLGNEGMLDLFIKYKADPCIKAKNGDTARSLAEEEKPSEKVSRIIAKLYAAIAKLHPDTKQCPGA